jgi:mRNA-degrading endonuclease RelE of RelBE toxin-antitoxin system
MYKIRLYKEAAKYYRRLDAKKQQKINVAIESLRENPVEGPHVKMLKGRLEGKCRYAVGDLRIIYSVNREEETVYVAAIGPRGDVYK